MDLIKIKFHLTVKLNTMYNYLLIFLFFLLVVISGENTSNSEPSSDIIEIARIKTSTKMKKYEIINMKWNLLSSFKKIIVIKLVKNIILYKITSQKRESKIMVSNFPK